jgi:multiple sugar transport system substrate-binding protein
MTGEGGTNRTVLAGSLAVMIALITLGMVAAGCGRADRTSSDGRTPVRISLMFITVAQAEYYNWAVAEYERRNPDVNIIIEQFPGSSLKDFEIKLRLRFSGRTPPDAFVAHENVVGEFALLDLLAPAPDYIERMVSQNSVNQMVRNAPYTNGVCYGIVNDAVWQALYYNRDHFREVGLDPDSPPTTWAEMIDYADRLTLRRPDGIPTRAGFSLRKTGFKPGTAEKWFTFLFSAGGQPFNDVGTEARFNSPAGRRALAFYQQVLEGRIDHPAHEGDQQGFGQGRVSMFYREPHVIRWMKENYPHVDFGVAPLPTDVQSISSGGSYVYSVSRDSPHPEAAWRFIEFLMQDEAYERYTEIGGLLPVTRSVAELPQFRDDPFLNAFIQQRVQSPTPFPRIQQATEILGAYIERFTYGHMDADEMLRRAERDVNAVLVRNRRL